MTFELLVLQDASRQADEYWANWLWDREQPVFAPSASLFAALAEHDPAILTAAWEKWFLVLTSWDFVSALVGRDVREILAEPAAAP